MPTSTTPAGYVVVTSTISAALAGGHKYWLAFSSPSSSYNSNGWVMSGTNVGSGAASSEGQCLDNSTSSPAGQWPAFHTDRNTAPPGTYDLLYQIDGTSTAASVSMLFPANNATTTDFANWLVNTTIFATTTTRFVAVDYDQNSTSTFQFTDKLQISGNATGSAGVSIAKTQQLIFPPLADGTTWFARPRIIDGSSTTATGAPISFQVFFPPSSFSSTSSVATSTINCTSGNFVSNSFCSMLVFLFVPTQSTLNQFQTIQNNLQNKPPFGYMAAVQTALNATATTTISSPFTTSTLAAISTLSTPLRAIFETLLWVLFVFWLFHKIRDIKL